MTQSILPIENDVFLLAKPGEGYRAKTSFLRMYTPDVEDARTYNTQTEAFANRLNNERVVPLSALRKTVK